MLRPRPLVVISLAAALVAVAGLVFLITRSDSSAENEIQGDVDCDTVVGSVDALHVLRSVAAIPTTADCLDTAADVDCDEAIDSVDSLRILRYIVQLQNPAVPGCPAIGEPLAGSSTPALTPTPTPSGTATPAATPTASGSVTPTATPTPTATVPAGGYQLTESGIDTSWNDILDFALIPGAPGEAAVIRQGGEVWKVFLDGSAPTMMGDLSGPVVSGGEEGLLSLAFSPSFQSDHRLYVYYTADACLAPSVTRCHHLSRVDVAGGQLDGGSEVVVLEIPVPLNAANHNGGALRFGHDDMLYVSIGDGGGAGDPSETGQDNTDLLGSVLRLDVDPEGTYSVPPDNPFTGGSDPGNDLVWAYGFRNPWRMSVDSLTGEVWLGDVGQGEWEEVDRVTKGLNYGWDCKEGLADYEAAGCPDDSAFAAPEAVYDHGGGLDQNQAVTGGYVYRGNDMPELDGWYVYGDAYSGRIWAVNTADSSDPVLLMNTDKFIYSFAELEGGELLVLTAGGIYRLAPA
jgi:glucose/arabinose dehydrogenase